MTVVTVGSLRSGGTTTLALTLATVVERLGTDVLLVDAARRPDLSLWAQRPGCPKGIEVARVTKPRQLDEVVHIGRRSRRFVVIDAGVCDAMLAEAASVSAMAIIPVRFSPLSASAAAETDAMLAERGPRRRALVATGITPIPSRIARRVERDLAACHSFRLPAGLGLRAAFEAPFLAGGTIHNLTDEDAPGLASARQDAAAVWSELEMFGLRRPERRDDARKVALPKEWTRPQQAVAPSPYQFA